MMDIDLKMTMVMETREMRVFLKKMSSVSLQDHRQISSKTSVKTLVFWSIPNKGSTRSSTQLQHNYPPKEPIKRMIDKKRSHESDESDVVSAGKKQKKEGKKQEKLLWSQDLPSDLVDVISNNECYS